MEGERNSYAAEVRDVFSGDDLVVLVDLGIEDLWKRKRVRLHGVDTPNAVNAGPDTEAGKLRSYVRNLLRGRKLTLTVVSQKASSWVVILYVETPQGLVNLNEDLIQRGYEYKR